MAKCINARPDPIVSRMAKQKCCDEENEQGNEMPRSGRGELKLQGREERHGDVRSSRDYYKLFISPVLFEFALALFQEREHH
jgi:hypothetical protein